MSAKRRGEQNGAGPGDQDLAALVDRTELIDVRTLRLCGEIYVDPPPDPTTIELKVSTALRERGDAFDCRFDIITSIMIGEDTIVANIEVALVTSFQLSGGDLPSRDIMTQFIDKVALPVAMPFVREAVRSHAVRLGLSSVTLGLLGRGQVTPMSATFDGTVAASSAGAESGRSRR